MERDLRPTPKNQTYLTRRILAGSIDYFLVLSFFIALSYFYGTSDGEGRTHLEGLPAFVMVMFWFLVIVGTEEVFGKTIGNSICGIRPISLIEGIQKVSFVQSLKRHLVDMIDMSMFVLVGVLLDNRDLNAPRLASNFSVISLRMPHGLAPR